MAGNKSIVAKEETADLLSCSSYNLNQYIPTRDILLILIDVFPLSDQEWKRLIPFDGRANKSGEYVTKWNDEIVDSQKYESDFPTSSSDTVPNHP